MSEAVPGQGPSPEQRGKLKTARIPIKVVPHEGPLPRKPSWIRARAPTHPRVAELKQLLREHRLHTVCEEAACPNLGECFAHGTATFMIMGDLCTRRCPFCDVAHGRPQPLDPDEPRNLAEAVALMGLKYVVITSVDRDDLKDAGGGHFARCVAAVRERVPGIRIEILTPDFRKRIDRALDALDAAPPDVFNHNLETVPRLYVKARPGADYGESLGLIRRFKSRQAAVPTKSGLMLGLGEELEEVRQVLRDLREHNCDMLTLGQYLQPSRYHLKVERFVHPDEFAALGEYARSLGFTNVASAPMVRSSYHADLQAAGRQFPSGSPRTQGGPDKSGPTGSIVGPASAGRESGAGVPVVK
jgi:lipoic acid synthetase